MNEFKRIPKHIGIIPDGNRRWSVCNGFRKEEGYSYGILPGIDLYLECLKLGIKELTFYGFTQDNTKRPSIQVKAFSKACIDAVLALSHYDANLLIVGDTKSPLFPHELLPYTQRTKIGDGLINVNFLVNYGWNWDIRHVFHGSDGNANLLKDIASSEISKIDLIIRWGGRRRLSGFLPLQSVYADFYVIDDMWPDFKKEHLYKALNWYQDQDITLGG